MSENQSPREIYSSAWDQSSTKLAKLEKAARKALNYIENTESELGIKLSCGDDLRTVLSELKG